MVFKSEPLELIGNSRRRRIIKILYSLGGEAHVKEVARRLSQMEEQGEISASDIKKIYISLLQNHLPLMDRAGLISYDEVNKIIKLNEIPNNMKLLIEVVEKGDISWSQYYLFLSVSCLIISVLVRNTLSLIVSSCFVITSLINTLVLHGGLSLRRLGKLFRRR